MLAAGGICLAAFIMAWREVPPLWRKGLKKECYYFFTLLLLATGLSIAQTLHADLYNPLDGLVLIYKPFTDFLFDILG